MRVSAVVFDFDNVIALERDGIGSDEVKESVWPSVFPEEWERLKNHFPAILKKWSGGKGSRFDVIRDALVYLKFQGDIEKEVEKRSELFNRLVQDGIFEMGVPRETRDFLEALSQKLPLFINTATPTNIMHQTLKMLRLSHLFKDVYGQEGGKVGGLYSALKAMGETDPQRILFVGDASTDYSASQTVGTLFVGVSTKHNGWAHGKEPFPVVTAVSELQL